MVGDHMGIPHAVTYFCYFLQNWGRGVSGIVVYCGMRRFYYSGG